MKLSKRLEVTSEDRYDIQQLVMHFSVASVRDSRKISGSDMIKILTESRIK